MTQRTDPPLGPRTAGRVLAFAGAVLIPLVLSGLVGGYMAEVRRFSTTDTPVPTGTPTPADGRPTGIMNPPVPPYTPTGSPVLYLPPVPEDVPIPVRTLPGDEYLVQPSPPSPSTPPPVPTMPAFLPPSDEWATYADPGSGITFDYPANWYTAWSEANRTVYLTNWPLEIYVKSPPENRVKVDVYLTPTAICAFPSLEAYLEALDRQRPAGLPGQVLSENMISGMPPGYAAVHRTHSGLMGIPTETFESFYVAAGCKAISIFAYAHVYLDTLEQVARTVRIP